MSARLTLAARDGLRADILTRGGYLSRLLVPMPDGSHRDVVLGYADDAAYRNDTVHLGSLVGRCANRIRSGRFDLGGATIRLQENAPGAHLHGGAQGYHRRQWQAALRPDDAAPVVLSLHDADGRMGYPGAVDVRAEISLPAPLTLRLALQAEVSAPTPVNLTWHPYFDLAGAGSGRLLDHELQVDAEFWLPMAEDFCPTGEIARVARTPLDLRRGARLADVVQAAHPQIRLAGGLDHCLLPQGNGLRPVAELTAPDGELSMQLWCTTPGLQVYSANTLPPDGPETRYRDGVAAGRHSALCLEPQGLPNAVNTPDFPSVIITPEAPFSATIEYRFRVA